MPSVLEYQFQHIVDKSKESGVVRFPVDQVHDEHRDKLSRSGRWLRNDTLQLKQIYMDTQPPLTSEAPVSSFFSSLATTRPIARGPETGLVEDVRHWAVHWAANSSRTRNPPGGSPPKVIWREVDRNRNIYMVHALIGRQQLLPARSSWPGRMNLVDMSSLCSMYYVHYRMP